MHLPHWCPLNLPSIVSDVVTGMVNPPEAPGNSLGDFVDPNVEILSPIQLQEHQLNDVILSEPIEDLHIDERVETLLKGYNVTDGKELETIGEALNATFRHVEWENWCQSEGFTRFQLRSYEAFARQPDEGIRRNHELLPRECAEFKPSAIFGDQIVLNVCSDDWFAGRWSCKGGDWKRNDEAGSKKKVVLNQGYPLCQMPKCGHEDPRWCRRDDLYYPSRIKKIDLPSWAFSVSEDNGDCNSESSSVRSVSSKTLVPRGVKGTILPVVRINSRVIKDHGSFETQRTRGNERHSSRSAPFHSIFGDWNWNHEGSSSSRKMHERDSQSLNKCQTFPTIPQDRVCTVVELALNLGEWYYLDGTGHECGPFFLEELRDLVSKGKILENMSIFRKVDNTWVPISRNLVNHVSISGEQGVVTTETSSAIEPFHSRNADVHNNLSSFHCLHPQFIGYMRGKLHELVMKSFKNREFAAAISEVLDPWISKKQPKKEMDGHFPFNYSISRNSAIVAHELSADKLWKSDERPGKRARLLVDESDACSETDEVSVPKNDCSFEELWTDSVFVDEHDKYNSAYDESWGFLSNHILARVFHFLKSDMNALTSSSVTCKRWNDAVKFYKSICRHVDLSAFGSNCSDNMFRSIMVGYDKRKLMSLVLTGCSNISANLLEEVLQVYPSITTVFIKGCNQFNELKAKLQSITWLKHNRSQRNNDESHANIRSLKLMTEKNYFASRGLKSSGIYLDDSDSGDFGNHCTTFRHGFYKRAKILDGRKSSSILSRDAQMRNWMHRKTETGYRKLEEYVTLRLKSIMKGNSYEFFTTKVTEIEDRMRRGYYVRHGSGSLKDDIIRMCRDAFKAKNYGDGKEMKHIFMSLIRLARSVEHNPMLNNAKDGTMKNFKDGSEAGLYSSKHKRRQNKVLNERKGKSNQIPSTNGGVDSGAFDREIGRKLFKLKNRNVNSDSETSDDHDHYFSEDDDRGEDESTASDTESDLDTHSSIGTVDSKGHGYFMIDDTLEAITDDREWGARMTKASLVPPITRKYEVIDKYLIVADEEEVQRKMRVALPDDYSERLLAQKSGIEESDMEIPEVKEYKPRKQLGVEVLEQEVYGIDPYTHNLLLDSMPGDPEWSLVDKHRFIEEVLLRVLNEQVRHFTGSGSTPMLFPLKPVVEEILTTAEEDGDKRVVRLSQAILKAINSRLDDNYVAYRKGLGVVCNKEEGFGEDDFVVEFLGEVYPSWKWFEKQDGIRSLQKNSQEPAPEFYNIYLERPKGDCDGYDLVVVDAMHKANYASRICHSCRPNCEAKVTAVDGHYQIGIYSLRPIRYGEEITFDYNSVTESKEEYEASVCLCGSHVCRGSYLNLIGEGAFQKVLMACHGILDRHKLILEACVANSVSQEDYIELGRAGLGTCLLEGLPRWLIAYSANLVRFMNFERTKLPDEILKHNVEEKKKFFSEICLEVEKSDSEIQAEGVYNSRLQNMALTLDKVKYVMRRVFGDPKKAPPPIKKIDQEELVSVLWKGEGSLVEELLQSMSPHIETDLLTDLKFKIHSRDPSGSDNIQRELRRSLLWLRDELRNLPCTPKCRHDAAADLIHMYAYTKNFFKVIEYRSVTSPPVYISPLDLGPKYVNKMGSGFQEYCKTYGENYCLGQLIYWHSQNNADPDSRLARARKGCLSLPDVSSFYGKSQKPVHERVYDSRTVRFMLSRMEKQPQRPWPKDRIWLFKSNPGFFGSPMLDAVLNKFPLDKEMVQWLKSRPNVYQGT
ncbi:hypothetical protein HPP92_003691 [Vanilla planifolia]|uniref:SET domain-containing protein n=1 Tax=Vanilla planifolia TaxID=51239 RepID=A0A835VK59_VANPL|nr:hypothetical protein HPP92_003691 [Vanilla planifolia]